MQPNGSAFAFVLFAVLCGDFAFGARILGIWPEQVYSHFVPFEAIMKGLVARGHVVDVLSHFPQKEKLEGYNDLLPSPELDEWSEDVSMETIYELGFWGDIKFIFTECGHELCDKIFTTEAAQKLLKSTQKYDLLLTEIFGTDCFLGYAHHFGIPSVLLTTSVNLPWSGDRIGLMDNPAYIPNYLMPFSSEMSFVERVKNLFVVEVTKIMFDYISVEGSNKAAKKYFGPDLPDLRDLAKNVSLLLANSHFSVNFPRPAVPNFVEVGGLHIREPKPIPKNIESVLNGNKNGVIYMAMGSLVKFETFAFEKLQAIFDTFAKLPHQVLIKGKKEHFNASLNIPKNVHFEPWIPQIDVLCHPNVWLFVSHGGALGGQEAVHCGVPRLGIPLFADQALNVIAAERAGVAIKLSYADIDGRTFRDAVEKLLYDKTYADKCERMARIFRDRPSTALDTALYWIEYVIRHRGAVHLRTVGADMPPHEYFLLDVIAGVLLAAFALIWAVYRVLFIFKTDRRKTKQH